MAITWINYCRCCALSKPAPQDPLSSQKGKGYGPAEAAAGKGHATAKFDVSTGQQSKPVSNAPNYTKVFANTLIDLAKTDDKICAVTAAMPDGTGLDLFAKRFGARCFDVGIAEQHAVTFSAALAAGGMKPFCAICSTFYSVAMIRWCMTWHCRACRCVLRLIAPGWLAPMGPTMPEVSTSPIWPIYRAWW
jgi:hypothetical protein